MFFSSLPLLISLIFFFFFLSTFKLCKLQLVTFPYSSSCCCHKCTSPFLWSQLFLAFARMHCFGVWLMQQAEEVGD